MLSGVGASSAENYFTVNYFSNHKQLHISSEHWHEDDDFSIFDSKDAKIHSSLQSMLANTAPDALVETNPWTETINPKYALQAFLLLSEQLSGTGIFLQEKEFSKCLDDLTMNGWFTSADKELLFKSLPHRISFEEFRADVCERRDIDGAVLVAERFLSEGHIVGAINWLEIVCQHLSLNKDPRNLAEVVDLRKYFDPGLKLPYEAIRTCLSNRQLRKELAKRTDIPPLRLHISYYSDLCKFLKISNSVQKVQFYLDGYTFNKKVDQLAAAIAKNSSLEVLAIGLLRIGDEGVMKIAAALKANNATQLKLLELRNSKITDMGAEVLLSLMELRTNLRILVETLPPRYSNSDAAKYQNQIRPELLERFRTLNAARPDADSDPQDNSKL